MTKTYLRVTDPNSDYYGKIGQVVGFAPSETYPMTRLELPITGEQRWFLTTNLAAVGLRFWPAFGQDWR